MATRRKKASTRAPTIQRRARGTSGAPKKRPLPTPRKRSATPKPAKGAKPGTKPPRRTGAKVGKHPPKRPAPKPAKRHPPKPAKRHPPKPPKRHPPKPAKRSSAKPPKRSSAKPPKRSPLKPAKRSPLKPAKRQTLKPAKRPTLKPAKRQPHDRERDHFLRLRDQARKKGKLIEPKFSRRSGKSDLRGTKGRRRDVKVEAFFDQVREGHLEHKIEKALRRAEAAYTKKHGTKTKPTFHVRYVFQSTGVRSPMRVGYPLPKEIKGVGRGKMKVQQFATATYSAFSVDGAMERVRQKFDEITQEVNEKRAESASADVFLSHVTAFAYQVDHEAKK
jgi:hypothetical protein